MGEWGEAFDVKFESEPRKRRWISKPIYETANGAMFWGDSRDILARKRLKKEKGNVQLVFTSPPFPLNSKKRYGNLQGEEYIRWFAGFAPTLTEYLSPNGSIVVEIGNAWEPGRPVMSTVVLRALLQFLEQGGLNLCQEFVWYNPARLPSPVQWVNVERIRVKDAFTRIWWMSPNDRPKANNRNVLREYSKSMKKLIETGKYNSGRRPSEHYIGEKSFSRNNTGAIPPNVLDGDAAPNMTTLLKGTNTKSFEQYQLFCRNKGLDLHPARMPRHIVEFFIKFLTDEGDLVLDPFAGSNTTGSVAEDMGRRWLSAEAVWSYASSSIARFDPKKITATCHDLAVESYVKDELSFSSSTSSSSPRCNSSNATLK